MSYQVLARKWRPKTFREMVGQEHVLKALINALDHDRLHHAYLFTGTRGVGKTTIARILAKCLNCDSGVSSEPCGSCASCEEIAQGRSVDLLEVDAASRTKVEDTRELLDNVQYAPTRSRYKVYLIDEVHMLSGHSFNALLKTLEEPPPHVKFLLATTDPQKLPATILSRCLQFNLKNMPPEQVVRHLEHVLEQEAVDFEEPALWLLGRAASGSMRDALSLTDQAIAYGSGKLLEADVRAMLGTVDRNFIYQLLQALADNDGAKILSVIAAMAEHAPDFESSLDELISVLHRLSVAQIVPQAADNSWGDAEQIKTLAGAFTAEDVQLFYQMGLSGKRDLSLASDARSGFEMCLLRMLAFRPQQVIDPSVSATQLQPVTAAPQEGVNPVKKLQAESLSSPVEADAASPRPEPTAATPPEPIPDATQIQPAASAGRSEVAAEPALAAHSAKPIALAALSNEAWPQVLDALALSGMVHNVASHCAVSHITDKGVVLIRDEAQTALFNEGHVGRIAQALGNYFGEPVRVEIEVGQLPADTPAMKRQQQLDRRHAQAVAAIESDDDLRDLMQRFDAQLDYGSISPLKLEER